MDTNRIKEIQQGTAYPDSVSVQQALLKVWNETVSEFYKAAQYNMDIKLKYRAWVREKHPDIKSPLTNSDIEAFAIEFAEWLVKNCSIPDVVGRSEHSMLYDCAKDELTKCPKCGGKSLVKYIDGKQCSFCLYRIKT